MPPKKVRQKKFSWVQPSGHLTEFGLGAVYGLVSHGVPISDVADRMSLSYNGVKHAVERAEEYIQGIRRTPKRTDRSEEQEERLDRKEKRLEMADDLLKVDLNMILFSDECLFDCTDMRKSEIVPQGCDPTPRRKSRWSAQAHVWGLIGVGIKRLVVLPEGGIDAERYIATLSSVLRPIFRRRPSIFMQDNAPAHSARATQEWLSDNSIDTVKWPPYSADLNPIENVWGLLKRSLELRGCKTKEDLVTRINLAWNDIEQSTIDSLVLGFHRRILRMKDVKGDDQKLSDLEL